MKTSQNTLLIALLGAILLTLIVGVGALLRQQAADKAEAEAKRAATEEFMRGRDKVIVGDGERYQWR